VSAPRPAPPEGRASWLDYVLDPCQVPLAGEVAHARAELAELREALADTEDDWASAATSLEDAQGEFEEELAELRKELADTKAQLALQAANTVEAMQQRDAAQAERDALRMTRARGCQCGDADVCAVIHEMSIERDSLRAQVAELRGAILGLGELEWNGWDAVASDLKAAEAFNALVARLRAEALPGAGEPAAGEGEGKT